MTPRFTCFAALFTLLLSTPNSFAEGKTTPYAPSEAIVIYSPGKSSLLSTRSIKRVKSIKNLTKTGKGVVALIKSDISTEDLIKKIKNDPNVVAVYPNYRRKLMIVPNDTSFSQLWGLNNTGQTVNGNVGTADADIDAPEAWEKSTGNRDIVVAVLDTGVDYTHEDLAGNIWVNSGEIPNNGTDDDGNGYIDDYYGYDFASDENGSNDSDPMDFMGHGSHVAGTIGAAGDNAKGIAGINWNVSIMALKVARPDGYLYDSDILEAMDYILKMKQRGVNIVSVNASYGGVGGSAGDVVNIAIDTLGDAGIVFVAAAGNESKDIDLNPSYPASYPSTNLISVAATDQNDNLAQYSNRGVKSVDIAAPGSEIYSSIPGGGYIPGRGDIFFDDMESGDSLWTHGGAGDRWAVTPEDSNSGSYAWSDSPSSDYGAYTNSYLTVANRIDLSSYDSASDHIYLAFRAKFRLEPSYDFLWVEISKDGGEHWNKIDAKTGAFGYGDGWTLYSYTVPPSFWSSMFMFRFRIESDSNVQYDGVYIDDVGLGTSGASAYDYYSGTSMAAPHVAGTVALLKSIYPDKSVSEIKSRILNSVDHLPSLTGKVSAGGRLNLNSAATNHPPLAGNDIAVTDINKSITIDILSNDTDPDGDRLTIGSISVPPVHGDVTVNQDNIEYLPQSGYEGNDSLVYIVEDGSGGSAAAKVLIYVGAAAYNDPPSAVDDTAVVQAGSSVTVNVLSNDSDPDGDTLTVLSVTAPSHGTASTDGTSVTYTPQSAYAGVDLFSYTVSDGRSGSDTAQVSVTVNRSPSAGDDTAVVQAGSSVTVDVLSNDSDADGDTLTVLSVTAPSHGTASSDGSSVTYTPQTAYGGVDLFSYTVSDGKGGSDTAQVSVTVNRSPSARDDSVSTQEGGSVTVNVLSNDSDPDGDRLAVISITAPAHGTVLVNSGSLIYTAQSGFTGYDSFSYTISDSKGGVDTAAVTVNVTPKPGGGSGGFDLLSLPLLIAGFLLLSYFPLKRGESR